MRALRTGFGSLAATIAVLALPAAALAEYLVPPGNSAATQYTEAVPTAGGDRSTEKGRKAKQATPAQALGADNVRKLDKHGEDGRATAELATETAPPDAAAPEGAPEEARGAGQGGSGASGGGGSASGPGGDANGATTPGAGKPGPTATPERTVEIPSGSSGFGEVLAQATGSSSSGQLGLLLPLVILGAIAWSLAYFLRQRRRQTA